MFVRSAIFALALSSGTALAQSDQMAMAREAAANQLGLMEYCQSQGYADADAVSASRASLDRLPPVPAGAPPTGDAEALGRNGTLSVNGTQTTLANLASSHNSTVGATCGQMADSAKHAAALAQTAPAMSATPGGIPGLPSMPAGMPSVPGLSAMPGGMPSIPGLPAAPAAAPR